jgi:rhomboid family protein
MIPLKDDNPTRSVPFVTMGIIGINLFVFSYMLFSGGNTAEGIVHRYAAVPARMFGIGNGMTLQSVISPVSSMFLHGSILHVGGNMLYLWIFGDNVEDAFGHVRFLLFYLVCGLAGAYVYGLTDVSSTIPMIGASGAISGVLGAYMLLYPRAGVWTFFFFLFFWRVIRVPAFVIIGFWILLQLVSSMGGHEAGQGGVAWFAHIGGFAAGVLIVLMAGRGKKRRRA